MPTLTRILGPNGKPLPRESLRAGSGPASWRQVRGRYEPAVFTQEDARLWGLVDSMSARSANSRDVRWRLRTRARQEAANGSYCRGIVDTLANDTIGTGPRLQLTTPDMPTNRAIEKAFMQWADCVQLPDKLQVMSKSRTVDGEAFLLFTNNPRIDGPVQLDIRTIEADQVMSPWLNPIDPLAVDGIKFDIFHNPVEYSLLRYHPGDFYQVGYVADAVDARRMIHWFRHDRPGQCRGIPIITPALNLFALLRRYTLAVLAAAETAADYAAVLESGLPPDTEDGSDDIAGDSIPGEHLEIERRMLTTLPVGWKMHQMQAEQPATTYAEFKHEIINEIARCLNMPFNIAAGNSSSYNYSSGRLDHQTYYKSINVDQSQVECVVLDRIFQAWMEEAWLATDILPGKPNRPEGWPHQWFWDSLAHIDPEKEARATKLRLESYTTTLAQEYASYGLDWETQIRQRAKEVELMEELGLPLVPPLPMPQAMPGEEDGDTPPTPPAKPQRNGQRNGQWQPAANGYGRYY
jgi:capsid protein